MLCPALGTQLVEHQLPDVPQLFWSAPPRCVCSLHSGDRLIQTLILTRKSSRPFHQVLPSPLVSPRDHALTSPSCCARNCVLTSVPAVRGSQVMYLAQVMLPLKASCSLWQGL